MADVDIGWQTLRNPSAVNDDRLHFAWRMGLIRAADVRVGTRVLALGGDVWNNQSSPALYLAPAPPACLENAK